MSAVYAKYVSMPIHPVKFPQKNQFPKKPVFPLSTLIILDWYPYVPLFPDLLCKFSLSVSGLRKIGFNAYTPRRISTKNQFPNKPGFPLSTLIILDWYPTFLCSLICCVNAVRVSAVYAKYISTPVRHFEFPQKN